jgi:hypothetical protein
MPTPDSDLDAEKIPPELEAFLRDLAVLSMRHGYWIAGCGECGSPWIEQGEEITTHFLSPTNQRDGYSVHEYIDPEPSGTVRAARPAAESDDD